MLSEVGVGTSLLDDLSGGSVGVLLHVLDELLSKFLCLFVVGSLVLPGVDWHENAVLDSWEMLGHLEVESWHCLPLAFVELTLMNLVEDSSGDLQAHSLANSVFAA